jgi:hypothetical protein
MGMSDQIEGRPSPSRQAGFFPGGEPAASSAELLGAVAARPTRRPIPPKLYRIGEVAAYAGTSRQTIHNYTTMGLIQECRWSEGGHRLYDETVFPRLDEILGMKAQRRSLKDIRERFLGPGAPDADESALGIPAAGRA